MHEQQINNEGPVQGQNIAQQQWITQNFYGVETKIIPLTKPERASLLAESRAGMMRRDWGEAPDVPVFFGRVKELLSLERWVIEERCRLVAIVGMKGIGKTKLSVRLGKGGIGKTDLSLKLARGIEAQFDS